MRTLKGAVSPLVIAAFVLTALVGCSTAAGSFPGNWGDEAAGKPSLTIKDDGSFSGNDGCNDMSGKGTISGDTFTFGPFATTQKACDGVHPWLNIADTAKVDGTTLTVYSSAGNKIGTLDKR
jgi:heat shock protein HslJ